MHDHGLQCVHDPLFVVLSYIVAVLGSYTALQLAVGIPTARNSSERIRAVAISGIAVGGAIWAMHFIAMLACKMELTVTYDIGKTFASALIAMAACSAGLAIVGIGVFAWSRLILGGFLMGIGVAGMHYLGMAAMVMNASIDYDMTIVVVSVLIAIVASIAALWLAFHMRGVLQMTGSALVMGVAVCGMHYTGMAAAHFVVTADAAPLVAGIGGAYLGATVFGVTTVLLSALLVMALLRQQKRALVKI